MVQDLVIIKNGRVIVQTAKEFYEETIGSFLLDSGVSVPDEIVELDYNKSSKSCWINGMAFQQFPNDYAEEILALIDVLIANKEKREQDKAKQQEAERLANMTQAEKEKMIQNQLTQAVQNALDAKAQELKYDSCLSVCSYVDTGVQKFDDEGRAFRAWRSTVWAKGYEILAEVQAGTREIPTEEELLAMLPELVIEYAVT